MRHERLPRDSRPTHAEPPAPSAGLQTARAALIFTVLGMILAYDTAGALVYESPKHLVLAAGVWLAWLGLCFEGNVAMPRSPLRRPLAAFFLVLLASAACSLDPLRSFFGQPNSYIYGILPLALCAALYEASRRVHLQLPAEPLLRAFSAGGALCALFGLLEQAGISPLPGFYSRFPGRAALTMGNPPYAAACLLVLLPPALHLALSRAGIDRILGRVSCALMAAGLAATLTRGAWGAALIGCAVYLLASLPTERRRTLFGARRLLPAAALSLLVLGAGLMAARHLRRSAGLSDTYRIAIWETALRIFARDPLLGSGPDTFDLAVQSAASPSYRSAHPMGFLETTAHDDLFQAAATLGACGLAAYLWLLWGAALLLREGLRREQTRGHAALVAAAFVALFIEAKLNPTPKTSHALAAILLGTLSAAPEPTPPRRSGRACALLLLLLCSGGLLAESRLYLADRALRRAEDARRSGNLPAAERAVLGALRLAPWEARHARMASLFLVATSKAASDPARMGRALVIARRSVQQHPANASLWEALGAALISAGVQSRDAGAFVEARRALSRAQELFPYSGSILQKRLIAARLSGDEGERQRLAAEFATLQELETRLRAAETRVLARPSQEEAAGTGPD